MTEYSPHVTDPIVQAELQRIAQIVIGLGEYIWTEEFSEPEKPRKGMVRFADGNTWDPGSGAGMYLYNGASWNFLQGAGGSGETNTSSNTGAGEQLAKAKVGVNLPFRTLVGGARITIAPGTDILTISADAAPAEANDLTAAVTWDDVPDGNVPESAVTQHEAALDHNELQNYAAGQHFPDATSDGSTYGRKDGAWSVMTGGGTEFLDITEFDDTDGTYYFYGGVDVATDWKINRYHKTTFVQESADEVGNPTETSLAEAWPDRLTLSYS